MVPKRFEPKNFRQSEFKAAKRVQCDPKKRPKTTTLEHLIFAPPKKGCKINFAALRAAQLGLNPKRRAV